ncbi:hypothetical protein [Pseudomonas sp. T1.Ur]|uniref:hypothetical protein n=1 Tax=Pseudomonas sp. T1.Ur TaxID=2928704 RepID=UPI00201E334E|nr:hypothetical protein [Pseudomonas sp. T1.Ur]MCL6699948.1 hypothetical protein [Pseudomonas sp. T1.Ur]
MKNRKTIPIIRNDQREEALLDIDRETPCIILTLKNNDPETYSGADIYDCLGNMIKKHVNIKFLCKGAKRTVRPSSMSSQMSSGIAAYEHTLGKHVSLTDIVNIFDYEDQDIINDPQLQKDHFLLWVESIRQIND